MMPSFYDVYLHMTYVYMIVYTYIYTIYILYTGVEIFFYQDPGIYTY